MLATLLGCQPRLLATAWLNAQPLDPALPLGSVSARAKHRAHASISTRHLETSPRLQTATTDLSAPLGDPDLTDLTDLANENHDWKNDQSPLVTPKAQSDSWRGSALDQPTDQTGR